MGGGASKKEKALANSPSALAQSAGDDPSESLLELPPTSLPSYYTPDATADAAKLKATCLQILDDKSECGHLNEFLKTEFSEELIDFYMITKECVASEEAVRSSLVLIY